MPHLYEQLLNQAEALARTDPHRPQQGNLRRSVSSTYYALFHFLIDRTCRHLIGAGQERSGIRKLLARGFAHTEMMSAARSFAGGNLPDVVQRVLGGVVIPPDLREMALLFIDAQDRRHLADYDLSSQFVRGDVLAFVARVRRVIEAWMAIENDEATQLFMLGLLHWNRIKNR